MTLFQFLFALIGAAVLVLVVMRALNYLKAVSIKGKPAPHIDGEAGDRIAAGKPTLFYFFSPYSGACGHTTPIIHRLAGRFPGVYTVDITRDEKMARAFGVTTTPTFIQVRDGRVHEVLVGPQPESAIFALAS